MFVLTMFFRNFAPSKIKQQSTMKSTTQTPTTESTKFVAYYRVSTKRQNLGLDAQQTMVANYINTYGGNIIAEHSEKESAKGSNISNRIELHTAIAECKKQHATLIVAKLDRLSRDVEQTFAIFNSGINIVVAEYPELDTLQLGIFATIAQHERELISKRTKAALAVKKSNGAKLGSLNGKSNSFTSESAKEMRQRHIDKSNSNPNNIRAWHRVSSLMNNHNAVEIAEILNAEQYTTPSGNGVWRDVQVRRLIKRYNNAIA